jgi:hypothetical protein
MVPIDRSYHKEHIYEIPINYHSKDMANVKRSRSQGQTFWYQSKGLVIRNAHIKYESPITYHSKDMDNVKVFEKWVKLQGQGHLMVLIERSCLKART